MNGLSTLKETAGNENFRVDIYRELLCKRLKAKYMSFFFANKLYFANIAMLDIYDEPMLSAIQKSTHL